MEGGENGLVRCCGITLLPAMSSASLYIHLHVHTQTYLSLRTLGSADIGVLEIGRFTVVRRQHDSAPGAANGRAQLRVDWRGAARERKTSCDTAYQKRKSITSVDFCMVPRMQKWKSDVGPGVGDRSMLFCTCDRRRGEGRGGSRLRSRIRGRITAPNLGSHEAATAHSSLLSCQWAIAFGDCDVPAKKARGEEHDVYVLDVGSGHENASRREAIERSLLPSRCGSCDLGLPKGPRVSLKPFDNNASRAVHSLSSLHFDRRSGYNEIGFIQPLAGSRHSHRELRKKSSVVLRGAEGRCSGNRPIHISTVSTSSNDKIKTSTNPGQSQRI